MATKTEERILARVKEANELGALCGLGTSPEDPNFGAQANRFIKRLADSGRLMWVSYTRKYGAGWALPENADAFKKG